MIDIQLTDLAKHCQSIGCGAAYDSRVRVSPEDLTVDDFDWLTAPVKNEVRGVRA